jgi:uncharacterized protein (TIGR02246 family)
MKSSTLPSAVVLASVLSFGGTAFAQDLNAQAADGIAGYVKAYNSGSAAEIAAFYAEDGVVFSPDGSRTEGRAAIQALTEMQLGQFGARDLVIDLADVREYGDGVVLVTTYSVTVDGPNGEMKLSGNSLSVSERDPDGMLRTKYHILTNDLASLIGAAR